MLELYNVFEDKTKSYEYYKPLQTNLFYVDIFDDYGDGIYNKESLRDTQYIQENYTDYLPPIYISSMDMDDTLLDTKESNVDKQVNLLENFEKNNRIIKPCINYNNSILKIIKVNIKMNSSLRPTIGNIGDGIDNKTLKNKEMNQIGLYTIDSGMVDTTENTNGQLYIRKDIEVHPAYINFKGKSMRVLVESISFDEDGINLSLNEQTKYLDIAKISLGFSCSISWRETEDLVIDKFHKDWLSLFYNRNTNSRFSYEVNSVSNDINKTIYSYNQNYRFASFDKDMLMFRHMQEMRALLFKRIIITLPKYKIILKGVFPNIAKIKHSFNYSNSSNIKTYSFDYNYVDYEIIDNEEIK